MEKEIYQKSDADNDTSIDILDNDNDNGQHDRHCEDGNATNHDNDSGDSTTGTL
jgi:hypothetical protein